MRQRAGVRAFIRSLTLRRDQTDTTTGSRNEHAEILVVPAPVPTPGAEEVGEDAEVGLDTFQPFNGMIGWAARALPWLVLWVLLLLLAATDPPWSGQVVGISGLIAAAIAALFLAKLYRQIPETLGEIWRRGVVGTKPETIEAEHRTLGRERAEEIAESQAIASVLGRDYAAYVAEFLRELRGGWYHWALGAAFVAVWNADLNRDLWRLWDFGWISRFTSLQILVQFTIAAIAFFLGFLTGGMVVVARKVGELGHRFDLIAQVEHPDKSGGLKPLGDLCLTNALIVAVPAIYLSLAIVILAVYAPSDPHLRFFQSLVPWLVVLALLAFLRPMSMVHQAMLQSRRHRLNALGPVGRNIDATARQVLEAANSGDTTKAKELREQLTLAKEAYAEWETLPIWPFDRAIIGKFITSTVLPVLGLLASLGLKIFD